jgi:hypothetical protein
MFSVILPHLHRVPVKRAQGDLSLKVHIVFDWLREMIVGQDSPFMLLGNESGTDEERSEDDRYK